MAGSTGIGLHIEGFEGFDRSIDFKKSKVRTAMRKAGRLVTQQAQMNLALARGAKDYPRVRSRRPSQGTSLASLLPALAVSNQVRMPAKHRSP